MTELKNHPEALAAALALCAVVPSDAVAADVQAMAEKIAAGMPQETVQIVADAVGATLKVVQDCEK